MATGNQLPKEMVEQLKTFHQTLVNVENIMQPLLETPLSESQENLTPLEKAKVDLVSLYAVNSLFWEYLKVHGKNPSDHGIKDELERIRENMNKAREISDRPKRPRVDQGAAKRFIRSGLWQPGAVTEAKEMPDIEMNEISVNDSNDGEKEVADSPETSLNDKSSVMINDSDDDNESTSDKNPPVTKKKKNKKTKKKRNKTGDV